MREHLASLVGEFRKHAAETAVVEHRGVRRYATTYGELAEIAGRFAAELERRGIRPGERVVLWGEDSAEWDGSVLRVPAAGSDRGAAGCGGRIGVRGQGGGGCGGEELVVGDGGLLAGLALSVVRSRCPLQAKRLRASETKNGARRT